MHLLGDERFRLAPSTRLNTEPQHQSPASSPFQFASTDPAANPSLRKRKALSDDLSCDRYGHARFTVPCETCGISFQAAFGDDVQKMNEHLKRCETTSSSSNIIYTPESTAEALAHPPKRRRAKRSEEERIEYLRSDIYVAQFEPYRVLCGCCNKWIRLRPNSSYCSIPWDAHRKSCLAKKINSRHIYALEERNLILAQDSDVRKFDAERVLCRMCDSWLHLSPDNHAEAVESWHLHRAECYRKDVHGHHRLHNTASHSSLESDLPSVDQFPQSSTPNACSAASTSPRPSLCDDAARHAHLKELERRQAVERLVDGRSGRLPIHGPSFGSNLALGSKTRTLPPLRSLESAREHLDRSQCTVRAASTAPVRSGSEPSFSEGVSRCYPNVLAPIGLRSEQRADVAVFATTKLAEVTSSIHHTPARVRGFIYHHLDQYPTREYAGNTPPTLNESRRRNAEQRAATLRADKYVAEVEPGRVFCRLCKKWVQLRQDSSYCAYPWNMHRVKCLARYERREQQNDQLPVTLISPESSNDSCTEDAVGSDEEIEAAVLAAAERPAASHAIAAHASHALVVEPDTVDETGKDPLRSEPCLKTSSTRSKANAVDLDAPSGRKRFVSASVEWLFQTTYQPTDALTVSSLLLYLNAAIPPRCDEFDTLEVVRCATTLHEQGCVRLEGDVLRPT